ncbi:hypothetical protein BFP70_12480 [Thioclava sp. SK-1]|uniref:DeoR/GlpR family DNA-binding transcription regulator n=1 Tax=Thioclava sp. SK-1 TaxID=1889770 RepID=UPI000824CCB5|nr:DeoR/GlpR family DNA-binding transcription regulator [Thioclava sp. SK-1]OCX63037.1 hypothetical protein BFP70_12480 [Thioclava sp. SK-1]
MLAAKRQARIVEMLRGDGMASLRDLAIALGSSVSTVRRDVEQLCEAGVLARTHGGAVLKAPGARAFEPDRTVSAGMDHGAKRAIGQAAAQLVAPGHAVIFDSSSTALEAARALIMAGTEFTAVTNDLAIAQLLSQAGHRQTHLTGGIMRPGTQTLLGAAALASITRLHADIAFIGAHAVDLAGPSDSSIELAEIKSAFIGAADQVVLLADHSKFSEKSFCRFAQLGQFDQIISDNQLSDCMAQAYRDAVTVQRVVQGGK